MTDRHQIWTTAVETMNAFVPFFQERTTAAMQGAPSHWFFVVIAAANEPRPLTVPQLQEIYPYNGREALQEAVNALVEDGSLEPAANGQQGNHKGYCATEKGRLLIQGFFDAAHEGLRDVAPLPAADLGELRDMLQTLVLNTQSPRPAHHSIFHAGRLADPGHQGSLAAQIDQYVTDLYYFRDDAHIAAWRPVTILSGPAWESLTLIWRDEAHTPAEVAAKRPGRRLSEEDYGAAFDELAQRRLVSLDGGVAQITDEGRRVREEAEARTDEIFFTAWDNLDAGQHERLHVLLQQMRDNLQSAARARMWPLINDVAAAMQPLVLPAVQPVMQAHFQGPGYFNHVRMAREAQPQPYTVQRFSTRFPYANPELAATRLSDGATDGYFEENGDGQYTLTAKGESAIDAVNDAFYRALGEIEVLPAEQMERLNELLRALVEAALESDTPSKDGAPSKACIRQTFDTAQPRDYAPLARVDLNIDDLNAFRDDAHSSAWSAYDVPGRDREAFTLVWRAVATTAAELAQQQAFRGYDEAAYAASLQALAERGWLQANGDGEYNVTAGGDALRQKIEQATDDIFYATWDDTLTRQQQNELRTLLIRLKLALETAQKAQEQTA